MVAINKNYDSRLSTRTLANGLTASVSPLGTTTFTYDANNRRTQMTDANGNITTYTWTDDNQLAAVALAHTLSPIGKHGRIYQNGGCHPFESAYYLIRDVKDREKLT